MTTCSEYYEHSLEQTNQISPGKAKILWLLPLKVYLITLILFIRGILVMSDLLHLKSYVILLFCKMPFQNGVLNRVQFFPLKAGTTKKGSKNENGRVTSPESVPFHFNCLTCCCCSNRFCCSSASNIICCCLTFSMKSSLFSSAPAIFCCFCC